MTREDVRRCFPGASEAQVTALLRILNAARAYANAFALRYGDPPEELP